MPKRKGSDLPHRLYRQGQSRCPRTILYLADRSPDAAERWYSGLDKATAKLSTLPERHPIAEDESEQLGITLRQMVYGRRRGVFRILISIEGDTVTLH